MIELIDTVEIKLKFKENQLDFLSGGAVLRIDLKKEEPDFMEVLSFISSSYFSGLEFLDLENLASNSKINMYLISQGELELETKDEKGKKSGLFYKGKMAYSRKIIYHPETGMVKYSPVEYKSQKVGLQNEGTKVLYYSTDSFDPSISKYSLVVQEKKGKKEIELFKVWEEYGHVKFTPEVKYRKIIQFKKKPKTDKSKNIEKPSKKLPNGNTSKNIYPFFNTYNIIGGISLIAYYSSSYWNGNILNEFWLNNLFFASVLLLCIGAGKYFIGSKDSFGRYGFYLTSFGLLSTFNEWSLPYLNEYLWFYNKLLVYIGIVMLIIGLIPKIASIPVIIFSVAMGVETYKIYSELGLNNEVIFRLVIIIGSSIFAYWLWMKNKKQSA